MKKSIVITTILLLKLTCFSAPFVQEFKYTNSTDEVIHLRQFGDEFQSIIETLDGYTALKDNNKYYYAKQLKDKSLAIDIELTNKSFPAIKHLRNTSDQYLSDISNRVELICGERNIRWKQKLASNSVNTNLFSAPPQSPTCGCITGITLLVDFPIEGSSTETTWSQEHPSVTTQQLDNLLNNIDSDNSVKNYFYNMSNQKLTYHNVLINIPILMDKPKSYYDDKTNTIENCMKIFMVDLKNKVINHPNYQSEILPALRSATQTPFYNHKQVKALNIYVAGQSTGPWSYGLWPHQWNVYSGMLIEWYFQNSDYTWCYIDAYQLSHITSSPSIQTFCHENGHMICDFPDLYDYRSTSYGVGIFSLMCYGNAFTPSIPADPYLAIAAGWMEPIDLPYPCAATNLTIKHDNKMVYRIKNPNNSKEYFLISSKMPSGLDSGINSLLYAYASYYFNGIVIWRCNEVGSNTYPSSHPIGNDQYAKSYECAVVQADGEYHFEKCMYQISFNDCWFKNNTSTNYTNKFNDDTVPTARWYDGSRSNIQLYNFSDSGETMTFSYMTRETIPSYKYTGQPITPPVTVTINNVKLAQVTDYNLIYSNNVNVGTAYVYIVGTNNYANTLEKKFDIVNSSNALPVAMPLRINIK